MDRLTKPERATKERRLRALAEAVAAYEIEFGEITAAEIAEQNRQDRITDCRFCVLFLIRSWQEVQS